MSKLEEQLSKWRKQMLVAGIKTPAPLEELEFHLREDIASLLSAGKSETQAFQLALSRLGNPESLATEFGKAKGPSYLPAKFGWIVWVVAGVMLAAALFAKWFDGKLSVLLAAHIFSMTIGYGSAFLAGGFGIYYVCRHRFRTLSTHQQQSLSYAALLFNRLSVGFVFAGLLLGMFWSEQNRGQHLTGDPREIGAIIVIIWLSIVCVCQRIGRVREQTRLILCIAGNVVVSLAWFGAGTLATSHGRGTYWPLGAFIAVHLCFLADSMIPTAQSAET